MVDELELELKARQVRRLAALCLLALLVASAVLVIDLTIKRAVVDKALEAKDLLDRAEAVTRGAKGRMGAGPVSRGDGDHGAGDDAGVGTPAPVDESQDGSGQAAGRAGFQDGPSGDGG